MQKPGAIADVLLASATYAVELGDRALARRALAVAETRVGVNLAAAARLLRIALHQPLDRQALMQVREEVAKHEIHNTTPCCWRINYWPDPRTTTLGAGTSAC